MSDQQASPATDYRDTVFLPRTDFPMKAGLAQNEPGILARWRKTQLYQQLRAQRYGAERFILHDGPPYANGDIHMGHALNKVLKDIIVRTKSLQGYDAPYVPGWDCHGLPIEWKVEEQYRKQKLNKDEVDPVVFRAECRAYAEKWVEVQREQFRRLGVMGEWSNPYLTMDFKAEAAIVGELLKFAETGQLYRGAKPVMWSPVERTALAEAEVEYEEITSTQIDVGFEIVESPIPELVGAHAVIWTTTPWTIPVNQAIAYGPEVDYVLLRTSSWSVLGWGSQEEARQHPISRSMGNREFLIASELKEAFEKRVSASLSALLRTEHPESTVVFRTGEKARFKGSDLAGTLVRHPMHRLCGFFAKPRPMLPGDFVTTDAGTGLVHMAPDHGEDDFLLCKQYGIEPAFAVNDAGFYREDWAWLRGQGSVISPKLNSPEGPICSDLREAGGLLAASNDYRHSYPHSWRSKAKIVFRCTPQWFIPMDRPVEALAARASTSLSTNGDEGEADAGDSFVLSEVEGRASDDTLRQTALAAIRDTRWAPARAENRITAMVSDRPDWVISRQRAWGVPIALYVHRQTGDYLRDLEVNARIIAAFAEKGADVWLTADHQALLGNGYDLADYEIVTDILDVWFDSGCTHVFTVEARYGENTRANLYVEGSDQHRGWFQSSLLESCGTRGRAPYDQVLTHGFALDGQGRKMSKSVGNVVDPLRIMDESGADILRLWVASTDTFDDVRVGKEVLAGASDGYRKLRNTFRYLLGALADFDAEEYTLPVEMPELERWVLARMVEVNRELMAAAEGYEYARYLAALTTFANNDLSAFFFDVRKDALYCDARTDPVRCAYRTVLDHVFHALVRWLAPILVFTTEEVWQTRFPSDRGSIHLENWPLVPDEWLNVDLLARWARLREIRAVATQAIEPLRREKVLGSSLEAKLTLAVASLEDRALVASVPFAEIAIVSELAVEATRDSGMYMAAGIEGIGARVGRTDRQKCGRCWRHLPEVATDGELCNRCTAVVRG